MNNTMNANQTRLIKIAIQYMRHRAQDPKRNASTRAAYANALSMLTYAMQEKEDCLQQFDDRME